MLEILSMLGGFLGSAVPEAFKLFREREDRKHELAVMDRQVAAADQQHAHKMEALDIEADIRESEAVMKHASRPSGVRWVEGVNGFIRPLVTIYYVLVLNTAVKVSQWTLVVKQGAPWDEALIAMWGPDERAILMAILGFWFGQRQFRHRMKGA